MTQQEQSYPSLWRVGTVQDFFTTVRIADLSGPLHSQRPLRRNGQFKYRRVALNTDADPQTISVVFRRRRVFVRRPGERHNRCTTIARYTSEEIDTPSLPPSARSRARRRLKVSCVWRSNWLCDQVHTIRGRQRPTPGLGSEQRMERSNEELMVDSCGVVFFCNHRRHSRASTGRRHNSGRYSIWLQCERHHASRR
jgi:hypothetical protein